MYHDYQPNLPFVLLQYLASHLVDQKIFSRCMRTLQRMCSSNNVLPKALVLTNGLSAKSSPETSGGFADIYQGYYQEELVALKSIRVFGKDDLKALYKVLYSFYRSFLIQLKMVF